MARKKVEKKNYEGKKRMWLIINFAMIMAFGVLIAVSSEVIGIAAVADKAIVDHEAENITFNLTRDIIVETNKVMNKSVGITVGIYGLVQLINYAVYLFKRKKVLLVLFLLEIVAAIGGYLYNGEFIMFGIPCLSALIYLRVLKLEES